MASQFTYDAVAQTTAVLLDKSPNGHSRIGTDGLATCLGVHILLHTEKGQARFIAHFDSKAEPKGPKDPLYAKVAKWMSDWMTAKLGKFDAKVHQGLATYSAGSFGSTKAMHDGICLWSGEKLAMNPWLGFWVPYGSGTPAKIPDKEKGEILPGEWKDCEVPENPA